MSGGGERTIELPDLLKPTLDEHQSAAVRGRGRDEFVMLQRRRCAGRFDSGRPVTNVVEEGEKTCIGRVPIVLDRS